MSLTYYKKQERMQGKKQNNEKLVNLINYYSLRKINTLGIKSAHKCMPLSVITYNLHKLMKHISKNANIKAQAMQ